MWEGWGEEEERKEEKKLDIIVVHKTCTVQESVFTDVPLVWCLEGEVTGQTGERWGSSQWKRQTAHTVQHTSGQPLRGPQQCSQEHSPDDEEQLISLSVRSHNHHHMSKCEEVMIMNIPNLP